MTKNSHAKKSKNCHTEEKKSKKYFHSFDAKKNLYHLRFKIIVALLNTFQNKYKFCLINYKNTFDKWKKLKYKEISEMEIKNLIKMFSNDEINKIIDNIEQNNILNEIFNEKFKIFFNMNIKYKDLYTEPKLKFIKIKGKIIQKFCQSFKYSINEYYPVFKIKNEIKLIIVNDGVRNVDKLTESNIFSFMIQNQSNIVLNNCKLVCDELSDIHYYNEIEIPNLKKNEKTNIFLELNNINDYEGVNKLRLKIINNNIDSGNVIEFKFNFIESSMYKTIKEFRNEFNLFESEYSNEFLKNLLLKNNMDKIKTFESLFNNN